MRDWTPQLRGRPTRPERRSSPCAAPSPATTGGSGPARTGSTRAQAGPGDLFVGLPGPGDGGALAPKGLAAAPGAPSSPRRKGPRCARPGVLLAAEEPLPRCGALGGGVAARAGGQVVGVTGSTGKTSTKDILAALLAPHRRRPRAGNFNTEIGLPLTILERPPEPRRSCSSWRCAAAGQIAELARDRESPTSA